MAHIERRGDKRWRARYRSPDGTERSRTFTRKTDAERWITDTEHSKMRGAWTDPALARTTLDQWSARWLATRVDLKPKTLAGYKSLLRTRIVPTLGDLPLGRLDQLAVREWLASVRAQVSASRTRQALFLLSSMLNAAVPEYIARNPCTGVEPPPMPKRDMLFITAAQVDDLAAAAGDEHSTLIYLLAYGGIRWGEAVALRRRRCDLLRGRLEIAESLADVEGRLIFGPPKTHQSRIIALPAFLREMLAAHLVGVPADRDALVFSRSGGAPIRHHNFWTSVWKPAVARAGLPAALRIHDLRHTCAALLIAQGAHPKMIQVHLGHSTITTTFDRYGHLFPDEMDRLATQMDAMYRAGRESPAAWPRPESPGVVLPLAQKGRQNRP